MHPGEAEQQAAARLEAVRRLARERGAEAALVSFLPDIRWAVGFSGSNGLLLVTPEAAHVLTDGRYREQAAREVRGATLHVPGYDLMEHVAREGLLGASARVLFQSDHLSVAELARLRELLPGAELIPASNLLVELVAAKTEGEIEAIRRAQALTEEVFDAILPLVQPGVSERDLAAEIVYQHLKGGAEAMAFEPIVASGLNGALPHARPTGRTLRQGDLVVIDMGCYLEGYASDMTRTVAVGEPEAEARRIYEIVREAQARGIEAVAAGASGRAVDRAAREVIEAAGLGAYFSHGLGHGVGLQVHEWPRLSYHVDHTLPEGAVVTVEPGVYLPERFGVRIEDLVVAREGGPEVLTRTPKSLLVL